MIKFDKNKFINSNFLIFITCFITYFIIYFILQLLIDFKVDSEYKSYYNNIKNEINHLRKDMVKFIGEEKTKELESDIENYNIDNTPKNEYLYKELYFNNYINNYNLEELCSYEKLYMYDYKTNKPRFVISESEFVLVEYKDNKCRIDMIIEQTGSYDIVKTYYFSNKEGLFENKKVFKQIKYLIQKKYKHYIIYYKQYFLKDSFRLI